MPKMLAFDVYDTLLDPHGVVIKLRESAGGKAEFHGVVSTDNRQTFTPNPDVYERPVE